MYEATTKFIAAVLEEYEGCERSDLTQVFMRGPFAGWSEREVAQLADQLDANQKLFPRYVVKD